MKFDPVALDAAARPAWPALRSIDIDGWDVRLSGGYTGRANSTTTTGTGALPLDERIARIEAAYADGGQPPIFRMPDFTDPAIGHALDARGYAPLHRHSLVLAANDPARNDEASVRITHAPDMAWLDTHAAADGVPLEQRALHDELFRRTPLPRLFAAAYDGAAIVSVAMTVLVGDLAVVQGVGTLATARRQGHGRRVMRALLAEAWRREARQVVLQVSATNEAAQPMYDALGFDPVYRYAYRKRG
ncbi:GNAT family N-acetyltransferase [Roseiterribacter gracilis]|uniref:Acetyltransferase n=1 Tax=Roseiterribacter gracilis TaxID=2812848 RepID=A0A8S8XFY5_9PROT|nr:acetyltransferase [Rhodospirillales bacterium TMPK1]